MINTNISEVITEGIAVEGVNKKTKLSFISLLAEAQLKVIRNMGDSVKDLKNLLKCPVCGTNNIFYDRTDWEFKVSKFNMLNKKISENKIKAHCLKGCVSLWFYPSTGRTTYAAGSEAYHFMYDYQIKKIHQ